MLRHAISREQRMAAKERIDRILQDYDYQQYREIPVPRRRRKKVSKEEFVRLICGEKEAEG